MWSFPFSGKRPSSARAAGRACVAACGARAIIASAAQSEQTNPDPTNNVAFAVNQACHSVSDLDVNVTRILSTGLILYKTCANGSPPYNYNPTT